MSEELNSELPDLTPEHIDFVIKAFESKLCCQVNPVAIIYKKIVCQDCFKLLRESYTHEWDLFRNSKYD